MSKFIEITISTTHEGSELVSYILSEYTDAGVTISDIQDVIDLERSGKAWDYADEGIYTADKTVLIRTGFDVDVADGIIENIKSDLENLKKNSPFDLGELSLYTREIDGDLWREQWKERFRPIHIGKIVIVPEWIDYEEKEGETKVLLDSNMAFGTGEHETTSMCVEYLSEYVKPEMTVLDVGCGSGILGITACKLGAKKSIMTDIDECAIVATKHNMALNNVANGEVLLKNLLDDNTVKGEIIVANIMAEVLIAFASEIGNNLYDGGHIILSGILADRLDKVKSAYVNAGFKFISEKIKGEWSACVFTLEKK